MQKEIQKLDYVKSSHSLGPSPNLMGKVSQIISLNSNKIQSMELVNWIYLPKIFRVGDKVSAAYWQNEAQIIE